MAGTKKMTTAPKAKAEADVETVVEEPVVEVKKKTYAATDPVSTTSVTSGLLLMPGIKSGIIYRWIDAGDKVDVEYGDIMAAIRSGSNYIYKPRFVIDDEDVYADRKDIVKMYENLYDKNDLAKVLSLPPHDMKKIIMQLPDGVKETIKSMAITAIDNGELDSIQTIKAIDEIFGTQMLVKMTS